MFTGIIEGTGRVLGLIRSGGSARLRVDLGDRSEDVRVGDSVCVDGACLTVTAISGAAAGFDLSSETLQRTTLGALKPGDEVNLERSLRVGDRLGGHFVLGHVDGIGVIAAVSPASGQITLRLRCSPETLSQLIPKGSVAVDGISLTVVEVTPADFSIAVLPYTLEQTTLRRKKTGDKVNIELDVIGKYVARLLGRRDESRGTQTHITQDFLKEQGFA